jgi:glycosyltransferase involved in cell wall biosynthesis
MVAGLKANDCFSGLYSLNEEWDPDVDEPRTGFDASVAVFTGSLDQTAKMKQWGKHEHRLAMVAPNSSALPKRLMVSLEHTCTGLLAPSGWAASVIRAHTSLPVLTVPHGLDEEFAPDPEANLRDAFTALHFSTSDRSRKGTDQLVQAWSYLKDAGKLPESANLKLILNDHVLCANEKKYNGCKRWGIDLVERPGGGNGFSPEQMAFVLQHSHLVIQPSRGEGFGMVPLQALACGTPIVATDCTGQGEYLVMRSLQDGFVKVETGKNEPIDDLPDEGSLAPSLSWESVAESIALAYDVWPLLKQAAMERAVDVCQEWSWKRQTREFAERIKNGFSYE